MSITVRDESVIETISRSRLISNRHLLKTTNPTKTQNKSYIYIDAEEGPYSNVEF